MTDATTDPASFFQNRWDSPRAKRFLETIRAALFAKGYTGDFLRILIQLPWDIEIEKRWDLRGLSYERESFTLFELCGVCVDYSRFIDSSLEDANLSGASACNTSFKNSVCIGKDPVFIEVKARSSCFFGFIARNAHFSGSDLSNSSFEEAVLTNADFDFANCTNVSFRNADLRGAKFRRTNLLHTNFDGALIDGVQFNS